MLSTEQSRTLQCWNVAMALFHSIFVVATIGTADLDMALPLLKPTFALPEPAGGDGFRSWLVADRLEEDRPLYITWVALAFSALSAAFHLLNSGALGLAPQWRRWYLTGIGDARCPPRWIEYSLSAPLQAVAIAYLTGTTQVDVVVAVFALVSVTMFFGHLTEVVARPATELTWTAPALERLTPHFLGYVPFVVAVAITLQGFARTSSFSYTDPVTNEVRGMPSFVYAIVVSQLLAFSSFTVVQLVVTLGAPKNYWYGELAYMTLSLVAKGVLSLLLLANVIALDVFGDSV